MIVISINFPVKSYIKKYLVYKFGNNHNYSTQSVLGPIVKSILSKNYTRKIGKINTQHYYPINISNAYLSHFGAYVDEKNINYFNNEVDVIFRSELYHFMAFNKEFFNIKYRDTLRTVLQSMVITEKDIKLETILKDFDRKKNEINALNIRTKAKKKYLS